jgi:hypothetical protein
MVMTSPHAESAIEHAELQVPDDFPTIQLAIDAAEPGDRILVAPGVYTGTVDFRGKDVAVESLAGPQATVLDGARSLVVRIGPLGTLQGFTVTNGIGTFSAGIEARGFGSRILDNVIEGNQAGAHGSGLYANAASPHVAGNVFRNHQCSSYREPILNAVLVVVNSSSPVIANNIFEDNDCRAVSMTLGAHSAPRIVNNTMVRNWGGVGLYTGTIDGTRIRSNVIVDNDIGLEVDRYHGGSLDWANNLVYGNGVNYDGVGDRTGTDGNVSAPPLFVDAEHDYHLRPLSPAIDTGDEDAAPPVDFEGTLRPSDGNLDGNARTDMGAFEASGNAAPPNAELELDLRSSWPTILSGESIHYRLVMTNSGNVALHGVVIADATGLQCEVPSSTLPPGSTETLSCERTALITDGDVFSTRVTVATDEVDDVVSNEVEVVVSAPVVSFRDVGEAPWYGDSLYWGVASGLTTGFPDGTYRPDASVTRAQATSMLWRFVGSPTVSTSSGFRDVPARAWYADAVDWASARRIVSGFPGNRFRPRDPITHAQFVSMMWKLVGRPSGAPPSRFRDVPRSAWYAPAVDWEDEQDLMLGFENNRFAPADPIRRVIMAEALYRLAEVETAWDAWTGPPLGNWRFAS